MKFSDLGQDLFSQSSFEMTAINHLENCSDAHGSHNAPRTLTGRRSSATYIVHCTSTKGDSLVDLTSPKGFWKEEINLKRKTPLHLSLTTLLFQKVTVLMGLCHQQKRVRVRRKAERKNSYLVHTDNDLTPPQ